MLCLDSGLRAAFVFVLRHDHVRFLFQKCPFSLALVVRWTASPLLFDILVLRLRAFQLKIENVMDFHADGKGKPIATKGRAKLNHLL